jgi:tetratricopeptide (TPR) repeat protein
MQTRLALMAATALMLAASAVASAVLKAQTSAPPTPAAVTRADAPAAGTIALLDRYARGDFDRVITTLETLPTFEPVLKELEDHGASWIAAGSEADRARRELAAATFALEAARIGEWKAWKTIQIVQVTMPGFSVKYHITLWDPPAKLMEWACALIRKDKKPTEYEHLWQLAAMSVAERAEDFEFLVGYRITPSSESDRWLLNVIDHAKHAIERFPAEQRFQLAYGIANEWADPQTARASFAALQNDVDSGGEATMRLGAMALRSGDPAAALTLLTKAESLTRDPWVIFLARYFAGQAAERLARRADALRSYRGALEAMPRAQSASVALASLLFRGGERAEASSVIQTMLADGVLAPDPWRGYADADDRFWPQLIAALRQEIAG